MHFIATTLDCDMSQSSACRNIVLSQYSAFTVNDISITFIVLPIILMRHVTCASYFDWLAVKNHIMYNLCFIFILYC